MGKTYNIRGVAMNPVGQPHGGGKGKASIDRKKLVTPSSYSTLGKKSRKMNIYNDVLIIYCTNIFECI